MNSASRLRIPCLSPGEEAAASAATQNSYSAGKPGRAERNRVNTDTEQSQTFKYLLLVYPLCCGLEFA